VFFFDFFSLRCRVVCFYSLYLTSHCPFRFHLPLLYFPFSPPSLMYFDNVLHYPSPKSARRDGTFKGPTYTLLIVGRTMKYVAFLVPALYEGLLLRHHWLLHATLPLCGARHACLKTCDGVFLVVITGLLIKALRSLHVEWRAVRQWLKPTRLYLS
jgi:hypothetical protein